VDLFARSWDALHGTVADLPDAAFYRPSGCPGWLVRDLVCHLIIGAQDVLITLATPSSDEPTANAVTYWNAPEPSGTDDPADAGPPDSLIPRLATAYGEPRWLKFHLDDLGSAAGRAAQLADPTGRVSTCGQVLTVADYLSAYVVEWTVHHFDLIAHLPASTSATITHPPAETLAATRATLEALVGAPFPATISAPDALRIATGRRAPTASEQAALGDLATHLPLRL
jgi:hypothetical protein